ncbi:magnesium transporter [Tomitella biformata]|uniref:magnesium transporter n=1 Tax=Tomitella biformata TaxID=630403 RepID=UPI000464FEDE|nr:magnesium transporter [Tomitella biformata]
MSILDATELVVPPNIELSELTDLIATWLEAVPDAQRRAEQVAAVPVPDRIRVLGVLNEQQVAELFDHASPHASIDVLDELPSELRGRALAVAAPDVIAEIVRLSPDSQQHGLRASLPADRRAVVDGLLSWPEDSVGARMTPNVTSIVDTLTVREANRAARTQAADAETIAYVYVTNEAGLLEGVMSFRDLVLAPGSTSVRELMDTDLLSVDARTDQEAASRMLIANHLFALPVVDEGRLIGIITSDDVADIIDEEFTEDAERQGGSNPLDVPYLRASPFLLWRKRILWLLALFIAEAYTGTVLRHFEEELETTVTLAFFIPLLIGTGGNTGTQITSTLVRAMAVGDVRFRDMGKVLTKELTAGSFIALTMALAAIIRAWTLGVGVEVAITVTLTVAAIVIWSSLIGSVLPLLLRRIGLDPAVVSAPMISTIVDGTGLIIYFEIARLVITG